MAEQTHEFDDAFEKFATRSPCWTCVLACPRVGSNNAGKACSGAGAGQGARVCFQLTKDDDFALASQCDARDKYGDAAHDRSITVDRPQARGLQQGGVTRMRRVYETGMTYENVFPKRRGVEMQTSEQTFCHPFFARIAGFDVAQSSLYSTRAVAFKKAS